MREGKSMKPLFAIRPSLFVHFIIKNPPTGEASGERRITKSAETSQAPVDRCTRTSLLPLLPSGPGGIHKIALRGTSARPFNITFRRRGVLDPASARVQPQLLWGPRKTMLK